MVTPATAQHRVIRLFELNRYSVTVIFQYMPNPTWTAEVGDEAYTGALRSSVQ